MKIVSWNVNGIRACAKKGSLKSFIDTHQPDFLCLQETKAHIEQVEGELINLGFKHSTWSKPQRKGYSGVATFSHTEPKSVIVGIGDEAYDLEGRVIISQFDDFEVYNIYFPNGGSGEVRHHFKQKFLADLCKHLSPKIARSEKIILLGDYNVAYLETDVYDPVRLSRESGFLPEERLWMKSFLQMGFVDTFRHFHPDDRDRYSWWSYRELARVSNRGWRIDHVCITNNLVGRLQSADILDQVDGSDHCPVVAEFK